MNTAQVIHMLFVAADSLDQTVDELPSIADDARITLSGLARALQLAAEKLKAEEAEREARLVA